MSDGDTPLIRDACPIELGFILFSFWRASVEIDWNWLKSRFELIFRTNTLSNNNININNDELIITKPNDNEIVLRNKNQWQW